jgi:hypothetical protein
MLLAGARRAERERRWEEAAALLKEAAGAPFPPGPRREAVQLLAALWESAGQPDRAAQVWQGLSDDDALSRGRVRDERGLPQPAVDYSRSRAAELSGAPPPPRPTEDAGNHAPGPLPRSFAVNWQQSLPLGERLVPSFNPGDVLCFAGERTAILRDAGTGQVRWRSATPFEAAWADASANRVLLGGAGGVQARHPRDGRLLWELPAEADAFSGFRTAAGRLFFLEGGRRLWAVDAATGRVLWRAAAPGASLRLPYPGGCFFPHGFADERRLLVQTSGGRLWLLDALTGERLLDRPTSRQPWPHDPVLLDDRRLALVEPGRPEVVLLDWSASNLPELARAGVDATTTLTGDPPRVLGDAVSLALLVPRNYGSALLPLEATTGRERPPGEQLLSRELLSPAQLAGSPQALFFVSGTHLTACSLNDGNTLWRQRLVGPGPGERSFPWRSWRVVREGETLLVFPDRLNASLWRFRWLFGSLPVSPGPRRLALLGFAALTGGAAGWARAALALPLGEWSGSGFPVLVYEGKTGKLLQRLSLLPRQPGPAAPARASWRLSPSWERLPCDPLLQRTRGGFALQVADRVWSLGPAAGEKP